MFTLPVRLLWSLPTLQARFRSGSITAVIVLCSSTEAETSLLWNQLDAFYRLMEQMSWWNSLCAAATRLSSPRRYWQVTLVEMKPLPFCWLPLQSCWWLYRQLWQGQPAEPRVSWYSRHRCASAGASLCLKLASTEPAGEEQIHFKLWVSGGAD